VAVDGAAVDAVVDEVGGEVGVDAGVVGNGGVVKEKGEAEDESGESYEEEKATLMADEARHGGNIAAFSF